MGGIPGAAGRPGPIGGAAAISAGGRQEGFYPLTAPKIIRPAEVWMELVTVAVIFWPTFAAAPSITTIVPSSR